MSEVNHAEVMSRAEQMVEQFGVAQRGGKKYLEVKHRIALFRENYALDYGIETSIEYADDKYVRVRAVITDKLNNVIASGLAEEVRGTGMVNKGSALENCETSAIGRALACLGLAGSEYASLNELEIHKGKVAKIEQMENLQAVKVTKKPNADALARCIEEVGGEQFEAVKTAPEAQRKVFVDFARQAFDLLDRNANSAEFSSLQADYVPLMKTHEVLKPAGLRLIEYINPSLNQAA
tara:strand:- start:926 stop:1636 length:711 start_codon:yes stop_codon:yes gene_type:complete